jgi:hypothetical protein
VGTIDSCSFAKLNWFSLLVSSGLITVASMENKLAPGEFQ